MSILGLLILLAYAQGFVTVSPDEFAKTVVAHRGLREPQKWFNGIWLPLHFVLLAGSSLVTGDLLWSSRLVSFFGGTLLVAVLWGMGRHFGGKAGGMLAAVLGATHPLVVMLSATAMVDIWYVALWLLGLRIYLKAHASPSDRLDLRIPACVCFTLACGFHYNAWIASILVGAFLIRDLIREKQARAGVAASLLILGSVPIMWVLWNWARSGDPTAFFSKHNEYSAVLWARNGWVPSPGAVLQALFGALRSYSPILGVLMISSVGLLFEKSARDKGLTIVWTVLVGFLLALFLLYARGGRPLSFKAHYMLLPSMLMVAVMPAAVYGLWQARSPHPRVFAALLSALAITTNLVISSDAIGLTKQEGYYVYTYEARDLGKVLRPLKERTSPKVMLEVKEWNFLALMVYLGRPEAVDLDRDIPESTRCTISTTRVSCSAIVRLFSAN